MPDKEGFFTKEEQDDILDSIPKDPQYNGDVVKKENTGLLGFLKTKKVEENEVEENKEEKNDEKNDEKNESTGFLTTLFGTGKVDCDKLLENMNKCVSEKNGTTMCRKQVDEWEKLCKNKDEIKDEVKDENKEE